MVLVLVLVFPWWCHGEQQFLVYVLSVSKQEAKSSKSGTGWRIESVWLSRRFEIDRTVVMVSSREELLQVGFGVYSWVLDHIVRSKVVGSEAVVLR